MIKAAIFNQALNAIKTNPDIPKNQANATVTTNNKNISLSTIRENNEDNAGQATSIRSRIKLSKSDPKKPLNLLSRRQKSPDNDNNNNIKLFSIQKKVIKKDLSHRLVRNVKKDNESPPDDNWKHDLNSDGPSMVDPMQSSIFIRNLPENIDYDFMRKILQDDPFISGIKIEKDTAEINFLRKDAAQKSVDNLNGRSIMGKKIKVALISELNAGMIAGSSINITGSSSSKGHSNNTNVIELRKRESSYDKKMKMDEDDQPKSIISRIKKNH